MTEYIYDSAARIGYQAAQYAAVPGCIALARYVSGPSALTVDECDRIFAAGLGVVPIFETNADEAEHPERGVGDALEFNHLLAALGCPAGVTVVMADDHNDSDPSQEYGYFTGAAPVRALGRLLCAYSSGDVVQGCLDQAIVDVGWMVETWTQHGDARDRHWTQLANTHYPQPPGIPLGAYDVNVVNRPFPIWGHSTPVPPTPRKDREVVYDMDPGDGKDHRFYVEHFGKCVELPQHLAYERAYAGELFVPCGVLDILDLDQRLAASAHAVLTR